MSVDRNTLNFIEALNRDTAMQDRLKDALDGAEDRRQAAVDFAASEGYEVTPEGMDAVKRSAEESAEESARLSDEDLENVAGGFNPQPEPPARTSMTDTSMPTYDPQLTSTLLKW